MRLSEWHSMVSLKNTIYLFLFGDVMKDKIKRMTSEEVQKSYSMLIRGQEAEELGELERKQRYIINEQERRKQGTDTLVNRIMVPLSKNFAVKAQNTVTEADSIIRNAKKTLQEIEDRKKQDRETRYKLNRDNRLSDIDRKRRERDSERISARLQGEHQRKLAEIQREQQQAKETRERLGKMRDNLRMNRLRRRR